jgi:uncharacterized protein
VAEDLFDVIAPSEEGESGPRVRLRVHVRPGAGRSAVVGRYGDSLHVRVAAPPVGGRANEATRDLLADVLGTKEIELAGGERSAEKCFVVSGVEVADLRRRLHELVDAAGTAPGTAPAKRRGPR